MGVSRRWLPKVTPDVFAKQMLGETGVRRYAENLTPLPMP
jgi:hypothetical protein